MGILTYKENKFYMDSEPFQIISGAMHYFRIPEQYWYDRLLKLKECGFNTVETYVCWNLHEPVEGEFNFSCMLDIEKYIQCAKALGLYVILRPGPYICAEWEFGGLPAWLLKYRDMDLRCMDEQFISKVDRFYRKLFSILRPYFASNGGNIIMLQVENEYGSYGDDKDYLHAILEIYRDMNIDCLFFTSDGPSYTMLNGGALKGECLSVANFGSCPSEANKVMQEMFPNQPFMCGEYWDGWFDHWGEKHHVRDPKEVAKDFEEFMDNDWSINMYMFHGGTNFNFWNGANYSDKYEPTVTSYDYGAPLSEAGDRTELYYQIRDILVKKYGDKVPALTAKESEKRTYGRVNLVESAELLENIDNLSKPIFSPTPKYMEDLDQNFGYVLYRTVINGPRDDWPMSLIEVNDRVQVFVDKKYRATYMRNMPISEEDKIGIPLKASESACLDLLLENMGRVNYGHKLRDRKGLGGVRFGNQFHFGWEIYPLPMDNLDKLKFSPILPDCKINQATFLRGELFIDEEPHDTFLRLDGFKKGFVCINGFNIGRYYEIGPQRTLYVPAPILKKGRNEIIVFESDGASSHTIEFLADADLG